MAVLDSVLVTGGCGFIGSNFIRMLLSQPERPKVVNLDAVTYAGNPASLADLQEEPRYRFVHGDICDGELLDRLFKEERFSSIVHFAAESHVDRSIDGPADFIRTNVVGTFTLLEAAKAHWIDGPEPNAAARFVHVSTDEVYGSLGETGLFTEETAFDPRSPYSATKAGSDHLVSAYHHTYGLPTVITNCSNNYGPYQYPEKLIPLVITRAIAGETLPVYGDGLNIRDWIHVSDHCDAVLRVLRKGEVGETYNIGGNTEKTNLEVVRTICAVLDRETRPLDSGAERTSLIRFVEDRAGHDRRYAVDSSKIMSQLGWSPAVGFAEGMASTVRWYLDNQAWVDALADRRHSESK